MSLVLVLAGCSAAPVEPSPRAAVAARAVTPGAAVEPLPPPAPPALVPPEPIRLHGRNLRLLPPKVEGVPRVLILGDSVAAGFGLAADEEPWPTLLAQRLAREDGLVVEVLNGGVFGFATSGGLVLTELGSLQPDIVVVELGGNDYLTGVPVDRIAENFRAIVAAGRGFGAQVLLVGVRLPSFLLGSERGRAFDGLYDRIAAELDVPLVPDMFEEALGVSRFMQPDLIHPTAEGQKVVADNILPQLRELVRAAVGR